MSDFFMSKERPPNYKPKFIVSGCFVEVQREFLFLKRHPEKLFGGLWCLPGGKQDPGDTGLSCVIRETKEETGIILQPYQVAYVATWHMISRGLPYDWELYQAKLPERPLVRLKLDEHTDHEWVTPERALQMSYIPGEDVCIEKVYGHTF